jgi:hypothetical protein
MKYDEQFLLKAADRLEQKAREIVFVTATRYGLGTAAASIVGGVTLHFFLGRAAANVPFGTIGTILTVMAVIGGVYLGRERAFDLRVEVHRLLALTEIERNTRTPPEGRN